MSARDKEKVDQMDFAKERIAEAKAALEASGKLDDPAVIEALLQAEKKCRLSNDAIATKLVAVTLLQMCREKKDWATLTVRGRCFLSFVPRRSVEVAHRASRRVASQEGGR